LKCQQPGFAKQPCTLLNAYSVCVVATFEVAEAAAAKKD
jgi:hypothetical protein